MDSQSFAPEVDSAPEVERKNHINTSWVLETGGGTYFWAADRVVNLVNAFLAVLRAIQIV